jgi:hypothetical protein
MHTIGLILRIRTNMKRTIRIQDMIVMNGKRKMLVGQLIFRSKKKIKVKAGDEEREKEDLSNSMNKITI